MKTIEIRPRFQLLCQVSGGNQLLTKGSVPRKGRATAALDALAQGDIEEGREGAGVRLET